MASPSAFTPGRSPRLRKAHHSKCGQQEPHGNSSNTNDLQQTVTAESNLQDVATLVATMHRNREPLLHCAVYIELTASDYNSLKSCSRPMC